MQLTFGMGFFWLLIALAAGDMVVRTAEALSKRGSNNDAARADLERRMKELEQRLAEQVERFEAREATLIQLEEKVEFTDRLLTERAASRDTANGHSG